MSANLFKRTGQEDFPAHLKVLVSGPPKSGKTSLLGTVPRLIILDTEPHANNLQSVAHLDVPYVTITNSDDLRQVLFMLTDKTLRKQIAAGYGWDDVDGVAIDTLDTLQKILKNERMKEQKQSQFLRDDWGWLKTEMESIVEAFTGLPMHVFFMVHTKTKEMGKGDDSYTVTLPGLEGAIAESIAGMVGYSLMSFREERVQPDGSLETKYFLRTEGDSTRDFLGTRVAGTKLPTVIEPNMATVYNAVMAARPKKQAAPVAVEAPAAPPAPAFTSTGADTPDPGGDEESSGVAVQQEVAQTQGQPPLAEQAPTPDARPADDEPINPAALGHVKKVYEAVNLPFDEAVLTEKMSIGQARELVKLWRAALQDQAEGKGGDPVADVGAYITGNGWVPENAPEPVAEKVVEPKVDGTIEEVLAYVGDDMTKAQEAFDLEVAKETPRKSLITRLENVGAKPDTTQTDVETQASDEPAAEVESTPTPADAPSSEDEAKVKLLEDTLGAEVVSDTINANAKCEVCGNQIDDIDLAELGQKRFNKILCVQDYLTAQRG
jgi:hypothetical protein